MSKQLTLKATKRQLSGTSNARRLRRSGFVPGILYGASQDNYAVQVDATEFRRFLSKVASENVLVNLEIEGAKEKSKLALIQNVQRHSLADTLLHIDFNAVDENAELHAMVPLRLEGEASGVKTGGILDQLMYEIEVYCLPKNLPETIDADVSALEVGDSIHVGDLKFSEGVSVQIDSKVLVAIVNESRAALSEEEAIVEETPAEGEDAEAAGDAEATGGE